MIQTTACTTYTDKYIIRLSVFLVFLILCLSAHNTHAATYTVTRFDDPQVSQSCSPNSCSLRQAVVAAASNPASTIFLSQGTYTLTIPGLDYGSANPAIGDLDILVKTIIKGAGIDKTIIQVGTSAFSGTYRIFDNSSLENVLLSNLTLQNGKDVEGSSGGCIRNLGVMTLDSVKITGCESPISGGGIGTYHNLTIRNSVITNNKVNRHDGGIANGGGLLSGPGPILGTDAIVTIVQSEISNNVSTSEGEQDLKSFGGGISNNARLTLNRSRVSGNYAMNAGGIISGVTGIVKINNSTISNNKAKFDTGGIDNEHIMSITNSTISGNIAGYNCTGDECNRAFVGGIINWDGDWDEYGINNSKLTIDNSTISGNQSIQGGGGRT